MNIVVTGGAGFIGSAVVRHLLAETTATVVNVDKLTYAGNLESLSGIPSAPRYIFYQADICNRPTLDRIFERHQPNAVVHLAAESHVDRSIDSPQTFVDTNVTGTFHLLESARKYWQNLPEKNAESFRFLHVSTDEVYGDLGSEGLFTEKTSYAPSSPYAASKAASDHLVRAWQRTYGLPTLITNCSNNYGPYQFPEKLIPHMILHALEEKPLPVYGDGLQVRDWLFVEDHARALWAVLNGGAVGSTYNVGAHCEQTNIDVVRSICRILDSECPRRHSAASYEELITFVADRPGHDRRYAIDASKLAAELNWKPRETFDSGLRATVRWYLENANWWQHVIDGSYRLQRIGTGSSLS